MSVRTLTTDDRVEILPQLPSLSIAETRDFYRDYLGFGEIGYEDENFLIIRRDFLGVNLEIHFFRAEDRNLCENSSIYIRGGGIDALHAEFSARNVPKISPIAVRPWDMEEFNVWDPHGNLLKFGRIPQVQG